jgi:hypothetical protein
MTTFMRLGANVIWTSRTDSRLSHVLGAPTMRCQIVPAGSAARSTCVKTLKGFGHS